jgi:3-methylcrotonyl-CoA carboxylase beta subunit
MPAIKSRLDTSSPAFGENVAHHRALADELRAQVAKVAEGGGPAAQKKHTARGKLLPRDRVRALLDPGAPFLELSQLAAHGMYGGDAPAAGIVTGIGRIEGREVVVVANDATVKGGTYYPMTVKTHLRAQEIAAQNRLPCVYLVDSGGAFLPLQDEVFPDKEHFGRIFYNQANLSARGIPQVAVVMGSCTAGGAYVPAMCDESIIVKGQGTIFLGGPPLVKAATGEVVSAEELGGGEVHSRTSGVTDHLAEDDRHALAIAREVIRNCKPGTQSEFDHGALSLPDSRNSNGVPKDPLYPPEDLYGIIPADPRQPFDVREIIARIVDGSDFHEFKALYGTTLVTGFAHIHGRRVGILANNGILFSESALKGTHFIELCCQRRIPLVFLQHISGLMVGRKAEAEGIAKNGAKLINAVSNSTVPAITIMTGASYGAGNYAMSGRAYAPRFLFTWPNHRIAVMGGKQLAGVLDIIQREAAAKRNESVDEQKLGMMKAMTEQMIEKESDPYFATARLWDDGIIDPRDTRTVVAISLSAAYSAPVRGTTSWGVFRH